MPIYEYRCNGCGKEFEAIQKFSDKPVKKCPRCSGNKVERLISKSSFVLKGEGWYSTGYAKKDRSGEKDNKAEGAPKAESTLKAEGTPKPACAGCPSNQND